MLITFLAIGAAALILFIVVQWKVAKLPMMPVDIYKNLTVSLMLGQNFLFGFVYQAYLYYLPMYLQNCHGYSPIMSSVLFIPMVGTQGIISCCSGVYISYFQRYGEVIRTGFGLWTLGVGLTLIFTRTTSVGVLFMPLLLIGFGVGCVFQPTLVALQAHSPKRRRAVIISNRNFFRCCGGSFGLAISAAVLQARMREALPSGYEYLAHSTYSVPKGLPGSVLDAYMAGSHAVFLLQLPLICICFIGTLFIRDEGLQSKEDKEDQRHAILEVLSDATEACESGEAREKHDTGYSSAMPSEENAKAQSQP